MKGVWPLSSKLVQIVAVSALVAAATYLFASTLTRARVAESAAAQADRIYVSFLQSVAHARGLAQSGRAPGTSFYWDALGDVRRVHPEVKISIVVRGTVEAERDRAALEVFASHPRDWSFFETRDGWTRSFYVLPTRNTAVLKIMTDIRSELTSWSRMVALIAVYIFAASVALAWYWREGHGSSAEIERSRAIIAAKVAELQVVAHEIGETLNQVASEMRTIEAGLDFKKINDLVSQIRMLAVNGSIEAARSAEAYRVFHALLSEINSLAAQMRTLVDSGAEQAANLASLRRKTSELHTKFSDEAASGELPGASKASTTGTSFRRVG